MTDRSKKFPGTIYYPCCGPTSPRCCSSTTPPERWLFLCIWGFLGCFYCGWRRFAFFLWSKKPFQGDICLLFLGIPSSTADCITFVPLLYECWFSAHRNGVVILLKACPSTLLSTLPSSWAVSYWCWWAVMLVCSFMLWWIGLQFYLRALPKLTLWELCQRILFLLSSFNRKMIWTLLVTKYCINRCDVQIIGCFWMLCISQVTYPCLLPYRRHRFWKFSYLKESHY